MKKSKFYIIITILILIFFSATSGDCSGEVSKQAKEVAEEAEESVTDEKLDKDQVEIYNPPETQNTQPNIKIIKLDEEIYLPMEGSTTIGKAFWIISEGELAGPVVVTIYYDTSNLAQNMNEENLYIATLIKDSWEVIEGGMIDLKNKTISFAANNFSIFGTFEGTVGTKYKFTQEGITEKDKIELIRAAEESKWRYGHSQDLVVIEEVEDQTIPEEVLKQEDAEFSKDKGVMYLEGEVWDGKKIFMTIDFESKDFESKRVSGSMSLDTEDIYLQQTVHGGSIDLETYEVDCAGSGYLGSKKESTYEPYEYKIIALLSKDMRSLKGVLFEYDFEKGRYSSGKLFNMQRAENPEKEMVAKEVEKEDTEKSQEIEEESLPTEPITYSGDAIGLNVVLIVNFKTTVVTGSVKLSGDDYVDATISGNIDIETFEVTTNFSGIMGSAEYGVDYPFNGTITGIISDDLDTFNGVILDDEGDGGKFTINK